MNRCRDLMFAGSFGNGAGAAAAVAAPVVAAGWAEPIVAAAIATTATPAVARRILFMHVLLPRR
jgi:hypothetical protein